MARSLSVAAWNLHQGLLDGHGRNDVIAACRDLDADVMVLPEAWWFHDLHSVLAHDIADQLGYELHMYVGDRPTVPRQIVPWRLAVFTRIPAARLPDAPLPIVSRLGPRRIVRVALVDGTPDPLVVVGVHLFGIHALRRDPSGWLDERKAVAAATGGADIVAGDFNIWGPFVRSNLPDLVPAVRGRTWPSRRPHSQIDHILISHRLKVRSSTVLGHRGSDHRALRVELVRRD